MIIGNKYVHLAADQTIQEGEVTKYLNIKIYPISLLIQLEPTYILISISMFTKIRANLTLCVE